MNELHLSFAAIAVATIANFFVGFLWYSVIFQKAWVAEMKLPMDQKPTAGIMVRSLGMNLVGCFLLAFVFANNTAAWGFVPGVPEMGKGMAIGNAAIFTWLGFFVPMDLNTVAFEGRSWKLFGINTSYHFTMLLVSAIILHIM